MAHRRHPAPRWAPRPSSRTRARISAAVERYWAFVAYGVISAATGVYVVAQVTRTT